MSGHVIHGEPKDRVHHVPGNREGSIPRRYEIRYQELVPSKTGRVGAKGGGRRFGPL